MSGTTSTLTQTRTNSAKARALLDAIYGNPVTAPVFDSLPMPFQLAIVATDVDGDMPLFDAVMANTDHVSAICAEADILNRFLGIPASCQIAMLSASDDDFALTLSVWNKSRSRAGISPEVTKNMAVHSAIRIIDLN